MSAAPASTRWSSRATRADRPGARSARGGGAGRAPRGAAARRRQVGRRRRDRVQAGGIDRDEWMAMRYHPELGAALLDDAGLDDVREWILCHHERPDGKGYPRGLRGDDIPLEARILAVADSYEAMTNDRLYRRAIGRWRAATSCGAMPARSSTRSSSRRSCGPSNATARSGLAEEQRSGASRARTGDLLAASQTLSQLSYSPRICAAPPILARRSASETAVWRV